MIWWQAAVLIMVGVVQAMVCVLAGAFIMFKAKSHSSDDGFFMSPKGDVFSIPDETGMGLFGVDEPSKDEKTVLERTNRFLKSLGGES